MNVLFRPLLLSLSLFPLVGCAHGPLGFVGTRGNGTLTTRAVEVAPFEAVRADGALDIVIEEGTQPAAEVRVDENLQGHVHVEVQGDTLVLSHDNLRASEGSRVRLVMPRLRKVEVSGASDVRVQPRRQAEETLRIDLTGAGEVAYTGEVGRLELTLSGAGDVHYEGAVEAVTLDLSGAGDVHVRGPARRLQLNMSGTGDVKLSGGEAERLEVELSGTGDLDAREFPARDVRVESSGTGDVRLKVAGGSMELDASGMGDIEWEGNASSTRIRNSGSGHVQTRR
jgi:hypothetical protein